MNDLKQVGMKIKAEDKERFDKLRKERGVLTYEMFRQLLDNFEKSQKNQK